MTGEEVEWRKSTPTPILRYRRALFAQQRGACPLRGHHRRRDLGGGCGDAVGVPLFVKQRGGARTDQWGADIFRGLLDAAVQVHGRGGLGCGREAEGEKGGDGEGTKHGDLL